MTFDPGQERPLASLSAAGDGNGGGPVLSGGAGAPRPAAAGSFSTPEDCRVGANLLRMLGGLFLAAPARQLLDHLALDETWEMIGLFADADAVQPLRDEAQSGRLRVEDAQAAFHELFMVPAGPFVFPFESCYRVAKPPGPLMGPHTAEVQAAYDAAGFALSPELAQPADHAGLELAFVAELLDRFAEACEAGRMDDAAQSAAQIRSFCQDHLVRWLPQLRDRIRDHGVSPFYAGVAALAVELVQRVLESPILAAG